MSPLSNPISRRTLLALAACGVIARPAQVRAGEQASSWAASSRSSFRLVLGEAADGRISAGIEIRLATGYKTYWRNPGDSGIPPRFDWTGSENLAAAEVLWPAPTRFADGTGYSIGYAADTILPVLIKAADPSLPVHIKLHMDYAVCEKICIPAQGAVALNVPIKASTHHAGRIATFAALVPERRTIGARVNGPTLGHADWSAESAAAGRLALKLDCGAEGPLQVFIEGPEMWAFGTPTEMTASDGRRRIVVPVEDRPRTASGRQRFVITLVGGQQAGEWSVDLDIPASTP